MTKGRSHLHAKIKTIIKFKANYLYYLLFISLFNYYVVAITSWWIKDYQNGEFVTRPKSKRNKLQNHVLPEMMEWDYV